MPVISKLTIGGHPVTQYDHRRIRQFDIFGETCPFAKVAESLNGTLPDPISYRIHRLQASGNSSQATGSVPKYNCQGASSVLNIGSFIKSDIYSVPITADGITATFSQSNGTYAITGTSSAQGNVLLHNQITLENGHKYLVPTFRDATSASAPNYFQWGNVYARGIPAANFYWPDQSKAQSWAIVTGNGSSGYCMFNFMNNLDTSVTGFDPSGCFNLIDLTQLYGAGNEPANPETVFQDYPEIPVGNDSWIKNDVIRSISSITLGGQTVSVDLRSAGSVYDEWASNSHGTRKVSAERDFGDYEWTYQTTGVYYCNIADMKQDPNVGFIMTNSAYTRRYDVYSSWTDTDLCYGMRANYARVYFKDLSCANETEFKAKITGTKFIIELATSSALTAGSPLTLASGLTPTDQEGNAVTFTEGTEATPSPNYPVPIVNSSYINITDGQDTNSASIDLAGLTDKDQVYVNVKSTNLFDEITEIGRYNNSTGAKEAGSNDRLRFKNPMPVSPSTQYIKTDNLSNVYYYDANGDFISYSNADVNPFTTPANCAFVTSFTVAGYGTTYKNDISIALYSGSPVPYMPHNTKGKVWHKANNGLADIGDQTWGYWSAFSCFRTTSLNSLLKAVANNVTLNALCTAYIATSWDNKDNNTIFEYYDGNNKYLCIKNTNYTNETTFANAMRGQKILYPLASPVWTDITSSAMGAALLALETIEETSNTITINNSGVIDMVQYFTPI